MAGHVNIAPASPTIARPLLEIDALRCHFGGLKALDGASFNVAAHGVTGLIGPNGAGKTTLFNCISGLLRKTSGSVHFDGIDITYARPDAISQFGLVRTFQLARGCVRMTVFEHLMLYGRDQRGETFFRGLLGGAEVHAQEQALRERSFETARGLKLSHVLDNLVTDLSGGQKKLLEIGRALMAEPKLILLDEPMAGVNPALVEQIGEHLNAIRAKGMTILLIEHEMALIEQLCDHVVVMAEGKFLTEGTFSQVTANAEVQEAYLGMTVQ
ncbi:ABC transporter ATP-binding protein [Achromobacter seleniivolatilans]|uniref:ABC transporter ATP-binding protein n=1 Tax=Achromobacter seleniivolatilans TaxID=3047478 RepID=A0ABY9M562_9BURK|nr:ABC transporter ATP-binding protein [Achromobacter sp. R39]WMD22139.1 ABC transporter ATP-binding protein [Achromobacter sp. R39]